MAFIKGLFPGAALTWVLAEIIGSNGSRAGWAAIHRTALLDYQFYWSWPLFVCATGLAWFIFKIME